MFTTADMVITVHGTVDITEDTRDIGATVAGITHGTVDTMV